MRRLLSLTIVLVLGLYALPALAFDPSDYRQNTYGPPTRYCDPARSLASNGAGTLGDPWNMSQCSTQPVAGDVVGVMPGVSVRLPTTRNDNIPAFNPTNSGTVNRRIVYVTKHAAVALANVATNALRTELRHDGGAPGIVNGLGTGTGCAIYGSNGRNYITYDGFFTDMAQAYLAEDSGVIRVENATGVHFRNFEIKGAALRVGSNAVIYRPNNAFDTVLSNFRAYDFINDPTGSATPQSALFSDQYSDQNFLIEHFEIRNTQRGPFLKGPSPTLLNYGTIRYGKIWDVLEGIRLNAQDANNITTIHNVLIYNYSLTGIHFSNETYPARNVTIDHVTIGNGIQTANFAGAIYVEPGVGSNLTITNSILDVPSISNAGASNNWYEAASFAQTANHNSYYRGGSAGSWALNSVSYTNLTTWQTATGRETNSTLLGSDPFTNRAGNNFTVAAGHAAKTASSTSGEIGAYAGSQTVGVDISGGTGDVTPPMAPGGLRIQ